MQAYMHKIPYIQNTELLIQKKMFFKNSELIRNCYKTSLFTICEFFLFHCHHIFHVEYQESFKGGRGGGLPSMLCYYFPD